MATVKFIPESRQSISAMKGVAAYCLQESKVVDGATGQRMVSGIHCDGENAFVEFMATKQAYHKTDGINFYHYVQSFSPDEKITPQEVHAVAREFAERAWPGHEILVTTHSDADHLHSHFVINSVGFENGKKLRQNPNTLKQLRDLNDEICAAHGLSVLPTYEKSGTKLSTREYRAALKGESWKFKLMADICDTMNRSGSKQDFISEMERRGYQMIWTDERKYITFTCPNKKKCRDIKLHDDKFKKENLEYELRYREEHYAHQLGRAGGKKRKRNQQYAWAEYAGDGTHPREELGYYGGPAGRYREFPAEDVFTDEKTFDRRADGRPAQSVPGAGTDDLQVGGDEFAAAGRTSAASDGEPRATGWEESRKEYERFFGKGLAVGGGYRSGSETEELENVGAHHRGVDNEFSVGGNTIRSAVYALAALSEDDEDPEERRKRIEAQENGEALGALLGLAAGVISGIAEENNELDGHKLE